MIEPPYCWRHSQTRCTNGSRPSSVRLVPSAIERALDLGLGGDPGVVGAEDPLGALAAHAVIAGQAVLDRVVQRVAHVQHAGDVRRRDGQRVVLVRGALRGGMEQPGIQPFADDPRLHVGRVVAGGRLEVAHRTRSVGEVARGGASRASPGSHRPLILRSGREREQRTQVVVNPSAVVREAEVADPHRADPMTLQPRVLDAIALEVVRGAVKRTAVGLHGEPVRRPVEVDLPAISEVRVTLGRRDVGQRRQPRGEVALERGDVSGRRPVARSACSSAARPGTWPRRRSAASIVRRSSSCRRAPSVISRSSSAAVSRGASSSSMRA